MGSALDAAAVVAGALIVLTTVASAIRATILPRGVHDRLTRLTTRMVRAAFRLWAGRSASYERRDRIMSMLGPVAVLSLLSAWLMLIIGAYALMYLGVATHSLRQAIELSGSSVFTLGTATSPRLGANLLTYSEAGLGLLLVTLLITYLPSIYGAFSRRENGVGLLRVRAGVPPQAATMLIRYHRIGEPYSRLSDLWQTWEMWFVDIEETHATFPILVFFRSPEPEQSWITAAGALLDGAAFWVAAVEHEPDPAAQLALRAGFQALQRIATVFDVPFAADPAPEDPISVSHDEWEGAMNEMAEAGVPLLADRDQAWRDWKGWRVNYDAALLNLARLVEAPPAPWLSDRSPIGLVGGRAVRASARRSGRRGRRRGRAAAGAGSGGGRRFGRGGRGATVRRATVRPGALSAGEPATTHDRRPRRPR